MIIFGTSASKLFFFFLNVEIALQFLFQAKQVFSFSMWFIVFAVFCVENNVLMVFRPLISISNKISHNHPIIFGFGSTKRPAHPADVTLEVCQ